MFIRVDNSSRYVVLWTCCSRLGWWCGVRLAAMNQYEEIKSLGRGAFAVVMLVRRKTDKEKFVIKRFHTPMSELNAKVGR